MGYYQKLDFGAGLRSPAAAIPVLPCLPDRPAVVNGKDVYGKHLIARDQAGAEYGHSVKYIILAVLALVAGCTSGTHKGTGVSGRAISPDRVAVYYSSPAHSKTIGEVSAHSFGGLIFQDAGDDAVNEIRLQAGKLGANGVVLYNFDTAPVYGAHVRGEAILVSP
jgi:uncharacterized protein YbjQ (UPF0145 family)